ncbi:hypothetical protein MPSEU_000948300 [Mayamaea pseudoterrestris]|nr:hypothetical protein MPSEU_000948300 [Mayamaea pseudoterrestris]
MVLLILMLLCLQSESFIFRSVINLNRRNQQTSPLQCICINCKWVTTCAAYHFVETKHEQPHMTENPSFEPREGSPTIHVNVRTSRSDDDDQRRAELQRMYQEHESETERAQARQEEHGEATYDLSPQITNEYDVVACADFVQDVGCWIRNMPEEIRRANPDFVPS